LVYGLKILSLACIQKATTPVLFVKVRKTEAVAACMAFAESMKDSSKVEIRALEIGGSEGSLISQNLKVVGR